jgi:hypothetical protein
VPTKTYFTLRQYFVQNKYVLYKTTTHPQRTNTAPRGRAPQFGNFWYRVTAGPYKSSIIFITREPKCTDDCTTVLWSGQNKFTVSDLSCTWNCFKGQEVTAVEADGCSKNSVCTTQTRTSEVGWKPVESKWLDLSFGTSIVQVSLKTSAFMKTVGVKPQYAAGWVHNDRRPKWFKG